MNFSKKFDIINQWMKICEKIIEIMIKKIE